MNDVMKFHQQFLDRHQEALRQIAQTRYAQEGRGVVAILLSHRPGQIRVPVGYAPVENLCLAYADRLDEHQVMRAVVSYDPNDEALVLICSFDELELFNSLNLENLSFLLSEQEEILHPIRRSSASSVGDEQNKLSSEVSIPHGPLEIFSLYRLTQLPKL
ncbi:hypothetical protein KFU94_18585 [Chloroflexi bacterium TSY]|nr:hypothetical protein [Chloroflexi bacterium TSY]